MPKAYYIVSISYSLFCLATCSVRIQYMCMERKMLLLTVGEVAVLGEVTMFTVKATGTLKAVQRVKWEI